MLIATERYVSEASPMLTCTGNMHKSVHGSLKTIEQRANNPSHVYLFTPT